MISLDSEVRQTTLHTKGTSQRHVAETLAKVAGFPNGSVILQAIDIERFFPFDHKKEELAKNSFCIVGFHKNNPGKPGKYTNRTGAPDFQVTELVGQKGLPSPTYLIEINSTIDENVLSKLEAEIIESSQKRPFLAKLFRRLPKNPDFVYSGYRSKSPLVLDLDYPIAPVQSR
ncbi:MAG: hypothetical protein WCV81_04150 [Microgenomates group bacterium]|jgi:hypothetical protein